MHTSILKLIYVHHNLIHFLAKNIHHFEEGKIQRIKTDNQFTHPLYFTSLKMAMRSTDI
jgi:hypothetical protein